MLLTSLVFDDNQKKGAKITNFISTVAPSDDPDLKLFIRDASTGQPIPVTGIRGASGEYIQTVSIQSRPARFVPLFEGYLAEASSTTTSRLWVRRSQYLLVQLACSSSTDVIQVQTIYYDVLGFPFIGEVLSSGTARVSDVDGVWYPTVLAFDSLGPDMVEFRVEVISGKLFSLYATAL